MCDHEQDHDHEHDAGHSPEHEEGGWLPLIALGAILALGVALHLLHILIPLSNLLLIGVMIASGLEVAEKGLRGLRRGSININLLVTVAAIGATLIGHLEEGASVVFLFNVAERLEDYATDRARHAIEALMELRPEVATVRRGGGEVTVPVEDVLPGEVFMVRPGDRIPLDGELIEGSSSVNQAAITGESVPVTKLFGDEVYVGTMNVDGFFAARVTRMSSESTLARILELVEEAEESRSSTESFVDRFSRWYTPAVIVSAILVATLPPLVLGLPFHDWVYRSLVVLMVACPCALAIATPVAMVSAIGNASRNGVLVKGSAYIEQMSEARVFAFDKTGTLTRGELEVVEVTATGSSEEDILRCAVALEAKSEHPIAVAILEEARERGVEVEEATEFKAYVGRGVEASLDGRKYCLGNVRLFEELEIDLGGLAPGAEHDGRTRVILSEGDATIGAIALMDKVREDAPEAVRMLKERGIWVEMLTGDNGGTAKAVAERLAVDRYHSDLLPGEKVSAVERLRGEGVVVMVGDGINDAPALAAADIGVAMGAMGSDVALETADIALMEDDLTRLDYILELSQATMRRVRENIALSILVKLGVAVLAIPGLVTLWMAIIIGDVGLSLTVVLNAMRLGRIRPK